MLVAIDDENEYFNPSLMPQEQRNLVIPLIRDKVDRNLMFCPHCLAASNTRHPVSFVNPKEKIVHFRHKSGDRTQECSSYRGESDQHLSTKLALLGYLSSQDNIVEVESRRYGEKTSRRVYRTPDVTVTAITGEIHAHEVQISPLTINVLQERTEALLIDLGLTHVHWYLSEKNMKDENINYLVDNSKTTPYQLLFNHEGIPLWTPMLQKVVKRTTGEEDRDAKCLYRQDSHGVKWIYHIKSDTLAFYLGSEGKSNYRYRLPGDGSRVASPQELLDPASLKAGGINRWALLAIP